MIHDNKWRSIIKTLTWRIVASLDTFLISWFITSSPLSGALIAMIEVMTKMFLYYGHERAWTHIDWGLLPFTSNKEK